MAGPGELSQLSELILLSCHTVVLQPPVRIRSCITVHHTASKRRLTPLGADRTHRSTGFSEGAFTPTLRPLTIKTPSAAFASDADRLLYSEHTSRKQAMELAVSCNCHEVNGAQAVAPCTTAQYRKEEIPFGSSNSIEGTHGHT